jgi:glycosyltransferase involved in cell wall biosynthesis
MRRLTVAQLLPALESGGVERSTLEIAGALAAAGHRALVVSAGGRLLPALEATGARHLALAIGRKSPLVLRHVRRLRRWFADEGVDIVHARSRLPAWLAWRALRGMEPARRPRFVTTVHGLNSPSRYSAIMARGERVVCVSETVRAHRGPAAAPGSRAMPTRSRCWPRCAPAAWMRGCGCAARASRRGRATWPNWKRRPCKAAWPTRWR